MLKATVFRGLAMAAVVLAGGCGGGGSSSAPTPTPTLPTLTIATSVLEPMDVTINEDASYATFSFLLNQGGETSLPVTPHIAYDAAALTLQGVTSAGTGQWRANFRTRTGLGLGEYSGAITLRLCQDAACATPHPGAVASLPYRVAVVDHWQTWQKSARHTGHVRITVDPVRIRKLWEYAQPTSTPLTPGTISFTRVAADASRVYFGASAAIIHQPTSRLVRTTYLNAIDLRTGALLWSTDLGTHPGATGLGSDSVGDPAIANGRVFIAARWDQATGIAAPPRFTVADAATGNILYRRNFESQGPVFRAPTPYGADFLSASGYYGNVVYNHRQNDGQQLWAATGSEPYMWYAQTPAVDGDQVIYYNGRGLDGFQRSDGVRTFSIPDAHQVNGGYYYGGAPVILADGSVVALSGAGEPQFIIGSPYFVQRPLKRYLPDARAIAWSSTSTYTLHPAARGDTIYAGQSQPARIDALNVATGAVLWSWSPPAGDASRLFHNLVVTENMLFASTATTVYAVNLADRSVAWTHPSGGVLAIAPGGVLLIVETEGTDVPTSNRRLVAYALR